ncbi:tRNA lysidine(34) synthetase TilS [Egibacter rhizosphaerae]|uniref:tRNA(Ile)-lysidine synthase n=1 Tax=Egibacter rhizosphaerae TaxID=1670831 RepID=A0A411YDQ6_9ACTN|nr:tRNA lysidine(34) synthetase TilS [Egibacter rhizosphaerae]QBI19282.1 tRNA lysidine(34) synthetase TilS [Egibacter rhizosphaerae]
MNGLDEGAARVPPAAASAAGAPSPGAAPAGQTREGLVAEVSAALRVVPHGVGVLIACSGGPDSTALAHLVVEARPDLAAAVAHVRHQLRPDGPDARVAAAHAAALGLRCHVREVHVPSTGEGPEAAARAARYTALARLARAEGARYVLVGHTADDRAETVALNLARGTGIRGLGGMQAVRADDDVRIVRPLLRLRRDDVRGFVQGEGLDAVRDPTNHDPDQRRWRARHEVLPALARLSGGSGDPVAVLTRLADLAADDADALDELAAAHARQLVARWGPVRALPTEELAALPRALGSRVLRLVLASVRGGASGLSADAISAALSLQSGQALDIAGGCVVTAGGGWLAAAPAGLAPLERTPVAVPGVTPLEPLGLELRADLPWGEGAADHRGQATLDLGGLAAPRVVDATEPPPDAPGPLPPRARRGGSWWTVLPSGLEVGLAVRSRRPGDRLPMRRGTRKLQDVLVDVGVPRVARELVPVVVDEDDQPVWVPGVAARRVEPDASAGARLWVTAATPAGEPGMLVAASLETTGRST